MRGCARRVLSAGRRCSRRPTAAGRRRRAGACRRSTCNERSAVADGCTKGVRRAWTSRPCVAVACSHAGRLQLAADHRCPTWRGRAGRCSIEGANGACCRPAQSKAILERLAKASGKDTRIFDRHLALEQALAGKPLVAGNKVMLLRGRAGDLRARCSPPSARRATTSTRDLHPRGRRGRPALRRRR